MYVLCKIRSNYQTEYKKKTNLVQIQIKLMNKKISHILIKKKKNHGNLVFLFYNLFKLEISFSKKLKL